MYVQLKRLENGTILVQHNLDGNLKEKIFTSLEEAQNYFLFITNTYPKPEKDIMNIVNKPR